jgi:hypothetical protein
MGIAEYLDKKQPFLLSYASHRTEVGSAKMATSTNSIFDIKMIHQEQIKGPLPKATGTAGSSSKFEFFFAFSPSLIQSEEVRDSRFTAPLHQDQKK